MTTSDARNLLASARRSVSAPLDPHWADPRRCARRCWFAVAIGVILILLPAGSMGWATEASLVAVLIAVLARHDGVITAMSRLAVRFPGYRRHQLIYHVGQLHRSMALAAIGWLAVAATGLAVDPASRMILAAIVIVLAAMAWTARDAVRGDRHERFERMHRYGGWTVLVVLLGVVGARVATSLADGIRVRRSRPPPSCWPSSRS